MIRVSVGNVGSGKTASEVREILMNRARRTTITNIKTKIKHCRLLTPDMIIKKEMVDTIRKKTGDTEPVYEYKLNVDFWKNLNEPVNVVLDEAHSIINSRRAMSKTNRIVTDWLSLIRRVLGQTEAGYGELVFVSQMTGRLDIIAREMAHQIRYHICHYIKTCKKCNTSWMENSEMPEGLWTCMRCDSHQIFKHSHRIEVWHFAGNADFLTWKDFGMKTFYKHYFINDIERVFPLYNTLEWDNMFGEYY